jgi:hypothetical protein
MNPVGAAGCAGDRRTFDCVAQWKALLSDYFGYKAALNKTLIGTVIGSYRFSSGKRMQPDAERHRRTLMA